MSSKSGQRKQYSAQFKFKVAMEAARGLKTRAELASAYEIHPMQVSQWKSQLLSDGADVFSRKRDKTKKHTTQKEAELYEQIGRLKMEVEWLKKKATQWGQR